MMQIIRAAYPYLFGVLFASVLVWFALCAILFKRIRTRHPRKFSDMGSPSLIANNSIATNRAFLRFLIDQEYRHMEDGGLRKLSEFMRIFLFSYFLLFTFLVLGVVFGFAP